MKNMSETLNNFLKQAKTDNLKTFKYPSEFYDLKMKVSFGMGAPARVPWIAFFHPEMQVSKGFYPVYLYYKNFNALILAYGLSETAEFDRSWPAEIMNSTKTISAHFENDVPRYGDSYVFRAYKVTFKNGKPNIVYNDTNKIASNKDLETDLKTILDYYKNIVSIKSDDAISDYSKGIFYMEKQLEDFIIQNWKNTDLGKKYDLITEEGEIISQQYKTDIGAIDILAIDKKTRNYVVIELKKNQTSDDTIGQLARYMGWIKNTKKDDGVKGIIIAGSYDKKLDYALKIMKNIEVYLYEVDFKLNEFKGEK